MNKRTVFVSNTSFEEAEQQARFNGFNPVGRGVNKKRQFVVFAQKISFW
jgi:hypothetical protein